MSNPSAATSFDPATTSSDQPPPDESAIDQLLATEPHHRPQSDYFHRCRNNSIDTTARQNSINWILKVHHHYNFNPVTAILSVNYLDRFLSTASLPATGWVMQLLSVACLSLAVKLEEPIIPLLIDLQVQNGVPTFVFEPRTVQRMELRVMVNLNWRLQSITPFDYLNYFISKLPNLEDPSKSLSTASSLILNTTRVMDFVQFSPSVIAAAAVISAAGNGFDTMEESYFEKVNQEVVRSCHQLIEEHLIDMCPIGDDIWEPPTPPPLSPMGVLDAAFDCPSCDGTSSSGSGSGNNSETDPSNKSPGSPSPTADNVQEQQP